MACKACGGTGKGGWFWEEDDDGEADPSTLTQIECQVCKGR